MGAEVGALGRERGAQKGLGALGAAGTGTLGSPMAASSARNQNHRAIRAGKALRDHRVQPSPYHQCHPLNHVPNTRFI